MNKSSLSHVCCINYTPNETLEVSYSASFNYYSITGFYINLPQNCVTWVSKLPMSFNSLNEITDLINFITHRDD